MAVGYPGKVFFTSDGAMNWEERSVHTDNAGATWTYRPGPNTGNLVSVSFTDDQTGAVGGYGNLSTTTNRGQSWTVRTLPAGPSTLSDVAWRGNVLLAAASGANVVYRSADGGATWTSHDLDDPNLDGVNALAFRDDDTVFAVSWQGTIMRSDDAGVTWTRDGRPTDKGLRDIVFQSDGTGWVVGNVGAILRR